MIFYLFLCAYVSIYIMQFQYKMMLVARQLVALSMQFKCSIVHILLAIIFACADKTETERGRNNVMTDSR